MPLPNTALVLAALALQPFLYAQTTPTAAAAGASSAALAAKSVSSVETLKFQEMFDLNGGSPHFSSKLLRLNGQRVRIVGCMADMETPPKGGFYLCARPVNCDESGGGIGDLPPNTIFVVVSSAKNKELEFIPRPLEVKGRLQVNTSADPTRQLWPIQIVLDKPAKPMAAAHATAPGKTTRRARPTRPSARIHQGE